MTDPRRFDIVASERHARTLPLRPQERLMILFQKIAEQRIQDAMERGEFDNLPGAGKPLVLDDNPFVPTELRMAYKVLKNAGVVPQEVETHKEIRDLEAMMEDMEEEAERLRANTRLSLLRLRLDMSRPGGNGLGATGTRNHERVVERLTRKARP